MRKELLTHAVVLLVVFLLLSIAQGWVELSYWTFWLGGLVGTFLPDLDHLIYVYLFKPEELTSQRVVQMTGRGDIKNALSLLYETRFERSGLIFHSALFQILLLVVGFLVISSSGSLLGKGLVLSFLLHLLVDAAVDIRITGGLSNWFKNPFTGEIVTVSKKNTLLYLFGASVFTLLLGLVL